MTSCHQCNCLLFNQEKFKLRHVFIGIVSGIMFTVLMDVIDQKGRQLDQGTQLWLKEMIQLEEEGEILLRSDQHTGTKDERLAGVIDKRVRILCWVMIREGVSPRTQAMKNTWGKRCDKLLFFGVNEELNAIDVGIREGRDTLSSKTFKSLTYLFHNHLHEADWFLKADDDSFIFMENLNYFLSDQDPDEPVYFGEHFNPYGTKYLHYNSGGAGYVLSRESLRRFGSDGPKRSPCLDPTGPEDIELGYCLLKLGIYIGESFDRFGKRRFFHDRADTHIPGNVAAWTKDFLADRYLEILHPKSIVGIRCGNTSLYGAFLYMTERSKRNIKGVNTMSDYPISFHALQPFDMYKLEFLFYILRVQGLGKTKHEVNRLSEQIVMS